MQALDRLRRTILRLPCDRPPVIPQIFAHSAKVAGRRIDEYLGSAAIAADCQLAAWRYYGLEAVFAVLDLTVEAEALGGTTVCRPGNYPAVVKPPFTPDDDFNCLGMPTPLMAGRMPEVVAMVRQMRAGVGDGAAVIGLVQGPLTLAAQFVGLEQSLFLAVDAPGRFADLLEYSTRVSINFGLAQLKAGAHLVLVFEPAGSQEVVPPSLFRELIGPRIARLNSAFKGAGALASWLHIAGQTTKILPLYSSFGVDIGNFDYCVEPAVLLETLADGPLCLDGNIKSLSFVTDSSDSIRRSAEALLSKFDGRGSFILSSGCEIPPEAEEANVAALVSAARKWEGGRS